jgi:hypothetical protein
VSDLISHIARLVPYAKRPKHLGSFVTAYVYEPPADDIGARLGNLYVVVEVLISGRASEEVVDLIIETVGEKYYNDAGDESDPLVRFEASIKQLNHALSEYVGKGNAAWIGKLSAVVSVQAGRELHVAQTGSAEAFLYRGKAVSRISLAETGRPATPSKTFGSIATGELEIGDKLLIATPALVHHVPLAKLQTLISHAGPNAAIAEISQLLQGAVTSRIAALVVEVTTPELAALKVRSDEPEEIQLSSNENLTDTAIRVATPLAESTANTSKKLLAKGKTGWDKLRPKLRALTLVAVAALRNALSTSKGRKALGITALAAVILVVAAFWMAAGRQADQKTFAEYQKLYERYQEASLASSDSQKAAARTTLADVNKQLNALSGKTGTLNAALKNNPLLQDEPTTVAAFKALVADQIDQLDGLIKVSALTLADIDGKKAKPAHFESDGTNAYIFDAANANTLSIVNLQTGVQKSSEADTSKLGTINATTLSAGGDGIYVLTDKPAVWFYRFADDSLTQQAISYSDWPKATSIASYGANLYLLGDGTVYKVVKGGTGYSPKADYLSTTQTSGTSTSLAVDGWIYVVTGNNLNRFLAGTLKQTLAIPSGAGTVTSLRSTAGGSVIIGTGSKNGRIIIWTNTADKLTFDKQIEIKDGGTLYDATYDAHLGKVFATIGGRLVSFSLKP